MNNHLNTLSSRVSIIFLLTFLLSSMGIRGSNLINNQATKPILDAPIDIPSRTQKISIPTDREYLYKSIIVEYLLPVVKDPLLFRLRLAMLIGEDTIIPTEESKDDQKDDYKDDIKIEIDQMWDADKVHQYLLNFRDSTFVYYLEQYPFPELVSFMKSYMGIRDKESAGEAIQTIANKLQVVIEEYTFGTKNKDIPVLLNITEPQKQKPLTTLRIVHNRATKKEARKKGKDQWQYYRLVNEPMIDYSQSGFKHPKSQPRNKEVNSFPNQSLKKNYKSSESDLHIPKNLRELRWSPSPYECAVLSKHVYKSAIEKDKEVTITIKVEKKQIEKHHLPDWKVHEVLLPQHEGYKAVIYHNHRKKQMVLTYRGSQSPSSIDGRADWATNIMGIILNQRGWQDKHILPMLYALQKAILSQNQGKAYSCTITGHSLGGWLAQLTLLKAYEHAKKSPKLFYMEHPIKVITFDSPGAKKAMLSMSREPNKENIIDLLDITNYYSSPNLVNCLHTSPGTRYRIVFKKFNTHTKELYTEKSHKIDRFIKSFHPQDGHALDCIIIKKWPIISCKREYTKLFNFISQKNLYHVDHNCLSPNQFDSLHNSNTQYETTPYNTRLLHARHIPQALRKWLLEVANLNLFDFLQEYLKPYEEQENVWCTQKTKYDIRYIIDALRTFQSQQNPYLLNPSKGKNEFSRKKQKLQKVLNNLPQIEEDVNPDSRSKDLVHIYQQLHHDQWQRKCCIIHGYPGLGKSTLARLYGHHHKRQATYQYIWWIDFTIFEDSVQKIMNELNGGAYCTSMINNNQRKKHIKKELDHLSGWLLIIDNAPSISAIKNLLPTQGGYILITTRNGGTTWNHLGIRYQINKLSEGDAQKFLTKLAPPKSNQERQNADLICKKLGNIPLALRNAGYSIRNKNSAQPYADYLNVIRKSPLGATKSNRQTEKVKNVNRKNTIKENRDKSETNKKDSSNGADNSESEYRDGLGETYQIIIDQIARAAKGVMREQPDKSEADIVREQIAMSQQDIAREALLILSIMAYLDPYGLTPDFMAQIARWKCGWFKYYLGSPLGTTLGKKGVDFLIQYGILSTQYRIHELCQDITRAWIKKVLGTSQKKTPAKYQVMHEIFPYRFESIYLSAVKLLENLGKSATKQSSLRLTGIEHARSLMKYVHNKQPLRDRLLCVIAHLQAQAYPLDLYIEPQAQEKSLKKISDMHKQVFSFIKSRHSLFGKKVTPFGINTYTPLLLIKGSAGAGKSTYAAYLTQELVKTYTNAKIWARIPIFIFLPAYVQKNGKLPANLLDRVLVSYGMTHPSIKQLQQAAKEGKQPLVIIMDSYDEAHLKQNIYTDCQLAEWGIKYSKFIITCRTNYLEKLPQAMYYRQEQLFSLHAWQAREISICPFDRNKIDDYIQKFVVSPYNKRKGKVKNRVDYYKKNLTSTLRDMAISPFMLCMLLLTIPKIQEKKNKKVETETSLYDVYKALTDVWLERERDKSHTQVSSDRIFKFCTELAFTMWRKNLASLENNDQEMASFFRQPQFVHAPLRQVSQGKYAFLQPSYRDFFAAEYINDNPLVRKEINQKLLNNLSDHFILFLTKGLYKHQKNQLIKQCWEEINKAFQEKNRGINAAYHLQLLYYIDPTSLQDKNLSSINLQGGNLSELDLTTTSLTEANLSQMNLINSKLPKDLAGCNLTAAQLPQDLVGCNFTGAQLPQDLVGCNLVGAQLPQDLSKCNLQAANLSGQNLRQVNLPKNLAGCNLTGAQLPQDLSKCNLKSANLSGQNLTQVNLPKNLAGCNLTGALLPQDLSKCHLKAANLSDQDLRQVKLPKNLTECDLRATQLPKDLSGHNLTGVNLSGQNLNRVQLPKNLSGCNLRKTQLPKDLSGCNLRNAQLPQDLSLCNLMRTNLSGQNLTNVKLPKNLEGCNLTGAQLPQDLSIYHLKAANLSGQDLSQAKLPKSLEGCNLTGAQLPQDLSKYNLKAANLNGQDLTQVNLPKNLTGCDLRETQLPKNLSGYNLTGVNLSGQNLIRVQLPKNLSGCNLKKSQLPKDLSGCNLRNAQLPKDLSGCNLRNAQLPQDLSGCNLRNAQLPQDLSSCNLMRTNLSGQNLTKVKLPKDLSSCNLIRANLSGQNLTKVMLPIFLLRSNITGANLSGQNLTALMLPNNLSKCNLINTQLPKNLSGLNLRDAHLPKDLSEKNLRNAQLPKDLSKHKLTGAILEYQDLRKIKLPKDLSRCNLRETQLPKDLSAYKLTGADLWGQNLSEVKLPQDLSGCDLKNVQLPKDLSGCDLRDAQLPKDLSGCDLRDAQLPKDLSSYKLTEANLSDQDLRKVKLPKDLSRCNLRGTQLPKDLSAYKLTGADFWGQNLSEVKLPQDLSGCDLRYVQLPQDLSSYKLTGANLSGQNFRKVKLPKDLSRCNLRGTQLPKDLSAYKLIGADLRGQNLSEVKLLQDLSGCDLRDAQLPQDLSSYKLTGANLSGQNLINVKLPEDLSRCDLTGAQLPKDLSRCDLRDAQLPKDLSSYKLTGANLNHQDLRKVKLPKDLSGCDLRDAQLPQDLSAYKLTGANLSGQNLTNVKLPEDLSRCDLTGAQLPKNLSGCDLTGAQLPNNLSNYKLTGAILD